MYQSQDIAGYIINNGLIDPRTGRVTNPQGIADAAQRFGVRLDDIDRAMGWDVGSSQRWQSAYGKKSSQDIAGYIINNGLIDPRTGRVTNPQGIADAAQKYGVGLAQIDDAMGWAPGSSQSWYDQYSSQAAKQKMWNEMDKAESTNGSVPPTITAADRSQRRYQGTPQTPALQPAPQAPQVPVLQPPSTQPQIQSAQPSSTPAVSGRRYRPTGDSTVGPAGIVSRQMQR